MADDISNVSSDGFGSAIAGLGSSLLATGGNIVSTMMTNQANKDLWREQMAYNTPLQQRKRLIEGGYNPTLAIGHGSMANVAGSPPTMGAPNINDPTNSILGYMQIKNMDAQRENILAQTAKTNAEARLANHEADIYDTPLNKNVSTKAPWFVPSTISFIDRLRNWIQGTASDSDLRRDMGNRGFDYGRESGGASW